MTAIDKDREIHAKAAQGEWSDLGEEKWEGFLIGINPLHPLVEVNTREKGSRNERSALLRPREG